MWIFRTLQLIFFFFSRIEVTKHCIALWPLFDRFHLTITSVILDYTLSVLFVFLKVPQVSEWSHHFFNHLIWIHMPFSRTHFTNPRRWEISLRGELYSHTRMKTAHEWYEETLWNKLHFYDLLHIYPLRYTLIWFLIRFYLI